MRLRLTFLALAVALVMTLPICGATDKFPLFDDQIPVRQLAVERNANVGGYLVVAARDPNFNHSGRLLEARRIERHSGQAVLGPVVLISDETLLWGAPELSFSRAEGTFLLVYVATIRGRPDGPFGRILSADGEPLSEPFRISPEDGCRALSVFGVAYSELTDRWLVAWKGSGAPTRCLTVRARFVRATGVPGHEVRVTDPANIDAEGDLAYSVDRSEFLVVWSEGTDDSVIVGRVIRERENRNSKRLVFAQADRGCLLAPLAAGGSLHGRFLVSWVNRCDSEIGVWSLDSRLLKPDKSMKRVNRYRTGEVVYFGDLAFSEPAVRYVSVWDEAEPGTVTADRQGYSSVFRGGGRPLTRPRTLGADPLVTRLACSAGRTECLAVWARGARAIAGWVFTNKRGGRP